jgi:hypothetical protein
VHFNSLISRKDQIVACARLPHHSLVASHQTHHCRHHRQLAALATRAARYRGRGAAGFLNDLSAQMLKRGKGFAFGEVVRLPKYLPDGFRVKVIDANATAQAEYTIQAGVFYGHDDYQVQQVMIPDLRWHFPDDPLYYARLRQPVLRKH